MAASPELPPSAFKALRNLLHFQNLRMAEGEGLKEPETSDRLSMRDGDLKDGTAASSPCQAAEGEEDEEDEEPRLKYASVSKRLSSLYRNRDAVSAFLVAGDKMVCVIAPTEPAHLKTRLTG